MAGSIIQGSFACSSGCDVVLAKEGVDIIEIVSSTEFDRSANLDSFSMRDSRPSNSRRVDESFCDSGCHELSSDCSRVKGSELFRTV